MKLKSMFSLSSVKMKEDKHHTYISYKTVWLSSCLTIELFEFRAFWLSNFLTIKLSEFGIDITKSLHIPILERDNAYKTNLIWTIFRRKISNELKKNMSIDKNILNRYIEKQLKNILIIIIIIIITLI